MNINKKSSHYAKTSLLFILLLVISIPLYAFFPPLRLKPINTFHTIQAMPSYKKEDVKDLKDITTALDGVDPNVDDKDLATFDAVIGNASIVGLGEGTHGTREFYQMKHRLLKYLVEKKGFTIFSMETSMPNAVNLNNYVLYGEGDPVLLVKNLGWTYGTQEVLSLLKWMHEYNQTAKLKIQFTGFDFQDVTCSESNKLIQNAFKTIGNEPAATQVNQIAEGILNCYHKLTELMDSERMVRYKFDQLIEALKKKHLPPEVLKRLIAFLLSQESAELEKLVAQFVPEMKKLSDSLNDNMMHIINELQLSAVELETKLGRAQYEWVLQNARLMQQNIQMFINIQDDSNICRDRAMADNILWLQQYYPGSKIVVWAHNGHVHNMSFDVDDEGREIDNVKGQYAWMGKHLKTKLGDQYRPIGFLTYEGKYTAVKQETGKIGECNLQTPPDNALESLVDKLKMPFALINLIDKEHLPIFLKQPSLYRSIGAMETTDQFKLSDVSVAFDGMIYIKTTSGSQIMSQ